jgi:hypothetical protein
MSDITGRVKAERGLLERIVSYIPGYHGYKEKEIRRESDRLVRQQVFRNLKKASDIFKRSLTAGVSLSESKRFPADRLISRLDLIKEKVAKTVGGYSGFFDSVKVKEDKLDRMISLDYELISLSSSFSERAEKMAKDGVVSPTWHEGLKGLEEGIDQIEEALRRRDELFS